MAHLSSNQYGWSSFCLFVCFFEAVFAVIRDQMKERSKRGERQTAKVAMQVSVVARDFTDSCITRLSAWCLRRLFLPFLHLLLLRSEQSVPACLHKLKSTTLKRCHTARCELLTEFCPLYGADDRRIYIWGVLSSSLVVSITGTKWKGASLQSLLYIYIYFFWHFSLQARVPLLIALSEPHTPSSFLYLYLPLRAVSHHCASFGNSWTILFYISFLYNGTNVYFIKP